jgi:hypothetical protein
MIVNLVLVLVIAFIVFTPIGGTILSGIMYISKGNYSDPYFNQKTNKNDKQKQKTSQTETQSPFD